jgi:hypothetical protein
MVRGERIQDDANDCGAVKRNEKQKKDKVTDGWPPVPVP